MQQKPLCDTCEEKEPVHRVRGRNLETTEDCVHALAIFPRAHKCVLYRPKQSAHEETA